MRMQSVSVVAKFKTCQYVLKTDLPNLLLAKFSRYTVGHMYVFGKGRHTLTETMPSYTYITDQLICMVQHV